MVNLFLGVWNEPKNFFLLFTPIIQISTNILFFPHANLSNFYESYSPALAPNKLPSLNCRCLLQTLTWCIGKTRNLHNLVRSFGFVLCVAFKIIQDFVRKLRLAHFLGTHHLKKNSDRTKALFYSAVIYLCNQHCTKAIYFEETYSFSKQVAWLVD